MEAPELGGAQVLREHVGGDEVGGRPAEVAEGLLERRQLEPTEQRLRDLGCILPRDFMVSLPNERVVPPLINREQRL